MHLPTAPSVAGPKVVKEEVAQQDCRLREATVRPSTVLGRPNGRQPRVVLRAVQFALDRTALRQQSPGLARHVLARPRAHHAVLEVPDAVEAALELVLELMTGLVREAMQNLADPPPQTRDLNRAVKGLVRPLRQAAGPPPGRVLARHRADQAVNQVGDPASRRHASAAANQAERNQEHDS
jgi:hypothetical protein